MRRLLMLCAVMVLMLIQASYGWAGNIVTRWVEQALDTVRAGNLSTPAAARLYAMTTVSMYDAVNGINRVRHVSTREHALVPPSGAPFFGDRRAAAAAAAHAVLSALLPSQTAVLDAALAQELADLGGASAPHVALGHDWGRAVGQHTVALRAHDGTQSAETLPPGTAPGAFRLPFTGAQFRHMAPFGVASLTPYAAPGPPLLTSAEYAAALLEPRSCTRGCAVPAPVMVSPVSAHNSKPRCLEMSYALPASSSSSVLTSCRSAVSRPSVNQS